MCRGEGLWAGPGENNLGEPHLKGRRRRGVGRVTWAVAEGSADMRVRQNLLGAGPGGWVTQWGQISPSHSHPHPPCFHFWGTLGQVGIFPELKAYRREGAKFRRLEWCGREGLGLQRQNASEPLRSCL